MNFFSNGNGQFQYEHLEHKSFAELFTLKHQAEHTLEVLRRKEPIAGWKRSAAYAGWVGRNVQCIENLDKIRAEILRRKKRARAAGINVFAFDGKRLLT